MEIFGKIHVSTSLFLVNFREKTLVKQKVVRSALFDPGAKNPPPRRRGMDTFVSIGRKSER